jgi:hypothetical protein
MCPNTLHIYFGLKKAAFGVKAAFVADIKKTLLLLLYW